MVESIKAQGTTSQPEGTNQQDDALRRFNEAIERHEAALTTSSPNAHDRYKKLDDLACSLADKACHVESNNKTGTLLEALEYAKQALELVPDNHVHRGEPDPESDVVTYKNKGTISNTLRAIFSDLYWETKNSKYLEDAIKHGVQAMEFAAKHREQYPLLLYQTMYSRRAYLLAGLYEAKFNDSDPEVGGIEGDLDDAIAVTGIAIDESPRDEDAYARLCYWCDLMVVKAGLRNELQYIDSAITKRSERAGPTTGDADSDEYQRAVDNDCERNVLLCRRWKITNASDDFQKLIDEAKPMTQRLVEMNHPQIRVEETDPRHFVTDANSTKDTLRVCGMHLVRVLTRDGSRWENHVPSIETAIKLYTELVNMIPINTKEGMLERDGPMRELTLFTQKRWEITQKPCHGFELDMINVYSAHQAAAMNLGTGEEITKHVSYGKSAGSGDMFTTFDAPSLPLRQQRFCFIGDIAPENWIRNRNDDGTLDLGATEDDTDILDFCRRVGKSDKSKTEGGDDAASVDDQTERNSEAPEKQRA